MFSPKLFLLNLSEPLTTVFKILSAALLAVSVSFAPNALAAKDEAKPALAQVRININSANAEMLADSLNGVGAKKAAAIVQYRKENGKFKSIAELALVKGIGEATIEKNRSKLTL